MDDGCRGRRPRPPEGEAAAAADVGGDERAHTHATRARGSFALGCHVCPPTKGRTHKGALEDDGRKGKEAEAAGG